MVANMVAINTVMISSTIVNPAIERGPFAAS